MTIENLVDVMDTWTDLRVERYNREGKKTIVYDSVGSCLDVPAELCDREITGLRLNGPGMIIVEIYGEDED